LQTRLGDCTNKNKSLWPSSSSFFTTTTTTSVMSHGRRPSLSNWLSRSSSSTKSSSSKHPYTPAKPVRISEPKFMRSLESLNHVRGGSLGSGAQIVRTPQDALLGSDVCSVSLEEDLNTRYQQETTTAQSCILEQQEDDFPSPSSSSGLHNLPFAHMGSTSSPDILNSISLRSTSPPRPVRAPPPPPKSHTSFHAAPMRLASPISEEFPNVPPLPATITSSPPQSTFQAIVVSGNPTSAVDPTKIIVSLETETQTYNTTIATLTSRPSHLANFIMSLLPKNEETEDASVYSEDQSMYHRFLATEGMLSKASFNLHIFLDRPSASYSHILSYLRCPSHSSQGPDCLPRNVKLQTCVPSRLDALLDLRDEACYLGLENLFRLCTDELRQRLSSQSNQNSRRNTSQSSLHSLNLLNHPLKPTVECSPPDERGEEWDARQGSGEQAGSPTTERNSSLDEPGRILMTPLSMHRRSDDSGDHIGSMDPGYLPTKLSQQHQPLTGRWI
jgi:hypothetical protein